MGCSIEVNSARTMLHSNFDLVQQQKLQFFFVWCEGAKHGILVKVIIMHGWAFFPVSLFSSLADDAMIEKALQSELLFPPARC